MARAEFQLEPLTCPSCAKKIETVLSNTKGIESAKVLFSSSKVKAEFDESQIDVEQIKKTIDNLGFEVLSSKMS
ncbi:MAG TPA: heavy-metal-associated domain-containing protein [Clostridiaceae bacterium]|nr:heavy-metal-associated domain-containing protein [Clostridiaceae bacterium]